MFLQIFFGGALLYIAMNYVNKKEIKQGDKLKEDMLTMPFNPSALKSENESASSFANDYEVKASGNWWEIQNQIINQSYKGDYKEHSHHLGNDHLYVEKPGNPHNTYDYDV
jgi:hypothetical protein